MLSSMALGLNHGSLATHECTSTSRSISDEAMATARLPFGGTALVWGPAVLVLAGQNRWVAATFLLIWGALLVGTIDNLLKPILVSSRAPVATLTVFIGVLGGIAAFGGAGLFLGPVLLALIIALVEFAAEVRRGAAASHAREE